MTTVEIEYCVPCGLREYAVEAQATLLDEFGQDLEGVRLTPGHGGVFKVHADGEKIWDKDVHGSDLDFDLILDAVAERIEATA